MAKRNSEDVKRFMICLVAALFLWMMFSTSEEYQYTLSYPLQIEVKDINSNVYTETVTPVLIQFESNGWKALLRKKWKNKGRLYLTIEENISAKGSGILAVNIQKYKEDIVSQFNLFSSKQFTILTDTVYVPLSNNLKKKVKVNAKSIQYHFAPKYGLSMNKRPVIFPDSVYIQGDSVLVSKITSIETEPCVLKNLSSSSTQYISLDSKVRGVDLQPVPSFIAYYIPVEEYTEQTVSIPVQVLDDDMETVKVYPDKVDVVVLVALKDYEKVSPELFKAGVKMADADFLKAEVQVTQFPNFVRIQKISPQVVDYVIIK